MGPGFQIMDYANFTDASLSQSVITTHMTHTHSPRLLTLAAAWKIIIYHQPASHSIEQQQHIHTIHVLHFPCLLFLLAPPSTMQPYALVSSSSCCCLPTLPCCSTHFQALLLIQNPFLGCLLVAMAATSTSFRNLHLLLLLVPLLLCLLLHLLRPQLLLYLPLLFLVLCKVAQLIVCLR